MTRVGSINYLKPEEQTSSLLEIKFHCVFSLRTFTKGQKFISAAIFATTLPFFLLLTYMDWGLYSSDIEVFWIQLAGTLGSILGFIGITLMLWNFVLGVRPFVKLFTPDIVWATKIHTLIGKYGLLLIFLHPLLIMYSYLEDLLWLITPDISTNLGQHIAFGRVALILFSVIWITSALIRSKVKYRPWLYIHYLNYLIILFVFIHALDIGTYLNSILALKALWFTLLAGFILISLYRLYVYSGLGKKKYKVTKVNRISKENFVFSVEAQDSWITPSIGQFIYVQLRFMGESHPFTVQSYDKESGEITFGIKVVGKFTKNVAKIKKNDTLLLEGPYGVFTREGQNDQPKIIFAGGIGITPFVDLIRHYGNKQTFLLYSVRRFDDLIEDEMFTHKLGNRYKLFLSAEKSNRKNVYNRRIDQKTVQEIVKGRDLTDFSFFICGSKGFIDNAYSILEQLGIDKTKIYHEEFEL